jgi:predicted nucleic acid-binding protein
MENTKELMLSAIKHGCKTQRELSHITRRSLNRVCSSGKELARDGTILELRTGDIVRYYLLEHRTQWLKDKEAADAPRLKLVEIIKSEGRIKRRDVARLVSVGYERGRSIIRALMEAEEILSYKHGSNSYLCSIEYAKANNITGSIKKSDRRADERKAADNGEASFLSLAHQTAMIMAGQQ